MRDCSRLITGIALTATLCAAPNVFAWAPVKPSQAAQLGPTVAAPMEFDVVSVKPNTSRQELPRGVMHKPDSVSGVNASLKMLIQDAYGVREALISGGPGWVDSNAYDFEGKFTPADAEILKAMTKDQRTAAIRQMLQHVLADRFKLKIHIETKTLPLYELVLAKGGSKLKNVDANNTNSAGTQRPDGTAKLGVVHLSANRLDGQGLTIAVIASFLSGHIDQTVVDKTGLTGRYDFVLTWGSEDESDSNAPDFFTAVQEQLGLKLVATKGPVDTIVIDSADKPDAN